MVDRSDYKLRAVQQWLGERKIKSLSAMKEIRIQKRNLYFFNKNKNSYHQILNFFPLLAKNSFDLISFVRSPSVVTGRCPCSLNQIYTLNQNKITRNYKTTIYEQTTQCYQLHISVHLIKLAVGKESSVLAKLTFHGTRKKCS